MLLGEGCSFHIKHALFLSPVPLQVLGLLPGTVYPFPATCSLPLTPHTLTCTHTTHTHTHIFVAVVVLCYAFFRGCLTLPFLGQCSLTLWSPVRMSLFSASSTHCASHQTVLITRVALVCWYICFTLQTVSSVRAQIVFKLFIVKP